MNKSKLVLIGLISSLVLTGIKGNSFIMELENYNDWNLPYSKTMFIEVLDEELKEFILPSYYKLETSYNAYFGVLYSGRPIPDPAPSGLQSITFNGYDNMKIEVLQGYWTNV